MLNSGGNALKKTPYSGFLVRLAKNRAGNVMPLVAAAVFPMAAMIGGAVDLSRIYMTQARLQNACDAGALAARRSMSGTAPTSADITEGNKFFDFNFPTGSFGTGTVTRSFAAGSKTVNMDIVRLPAIDFTGATNTPTMNKNVAASFFGSVTLISGMNVTSSSAWTYQGRGSASLTTAGKNLNGNVNIGGIGGTLTLQDALAMTGSINHTNGTFDANDKNITSTASGNGYVSSGSGTRVLNMGNGTWEFSGAHASNPLWSVSGSNFTLNKENGVIYFSNTGTTARVFTGGAKSYYKFEMAGAASIGACTINDNNTFDILKGNPNSNIIFASGSTQTVSAASGVQMDGTSGNNILLSGVAGGGAESLSVASGTVTVNYCTITNHTATGGAAFDAVTSTDGGGNSGWVFGGTTYNESIDLDGVGGFTALASLDLPASISLAADGGFSAALEKHLNETAAFDGVADLAAAKNMTLEKAVALSGIADMDTSAAITIDLAIALPVAGADIVAAAVRTLEATASFDGDAGMTASLVNVLEASVALDAAADLSALYGRVMEESAALGGAASVTVTADRHLNLSITMPSIAAAQIAMQQVFNKEISFDATADLSAAGAIEMFVSIPLAGAADISASANKTVDVSFALAGVADLEAARQVIFEHGISLGAAADLSIAKDMTLNLDINIIAAAALAARLSIAGEEITQIREIAGYVFTNTILNGEVFTRPALQGEAFTNTPITVIINIKDQS